MHWSSPTSICSYCGADSKTLLGRFEGDLKSRYMWDCVLKLDQQIFASAMLLCNWILPLLLYLLSPLTQPIWPGSTQVRSGRVRLGWVRVWVTSTGFRVGSAKISTQPDPTQPNPVTAGWLEHLDCGSFRNDFRLKPRCRAFGCLVSSSDEGIAESEREDEVSVLSNGLGERSLATGVVINSWSKTNVNRRGTCSDLFEELFLRDFVCEASASRHCRREEERTSF